MTKPDDYLWDRSGRDDPEVARLEELLSPLAHDRAARRAARCAGAQPRAVDRRSVSRSRSPPRSLIVVFALPRGRPDVACRGSDRASRSPAAAARWRAAAAASRAGVLPVGGVLDTGAHEAELTIADIGTAQLGEQNACAARSHGRASAISSHLERGKMHAKCQRAAADVRGHHAAAPSRRSRLRVRSYVDDAGAGSIGVLTGARRARDQVRRGRGRSRRHARGLARRTTARASGRPPSESRRFAPRSRASMRAMPARSTRCFATPTSDAITLIAVAVVDPAHR